MLGIGIMSSKRVGINHKEYGVTSTGVVRFAEIAMREIGVDITDRSVLREVHRAVPNGDVAGKRHAHPARPVPAGTDPADRRRHRGALRSAGIDRGELSRIVLKAT